MPTWITIRTFIAIFFALFGLRLMASTDEMRASLGALFAALGGVVLRKWGCRPISAECVCSRRSDRPAASNGGLACALLGIVKPRPAVRLLSELLVFRHLGARLASMRRPSSETVVWYRFVSIGELRRRTTSNSRFRVSYQNVQSPLRVALLSFAASFSRAGG
jgi:hypothetical protein